MKRFCYLSNKLFKNVCNPSYNLGIVKKMDKSFSCQPDFSEIESYLCKYEGGSIYISKEYWNEGIALLYLNHPEKRNAISGKMMVDFRNSVAELETWQEGKAVVLCATGDNFCSGGDLDFARATGTEEGGHRMCTLMHDVLRRFRKLSLVSVSLVHGVALGGGSELSIYTDYVLVTDNLKLGFVHGRMGLITAWGGTTRLVQLLGQRKALEILLSAKVYNAEDCLKLGLANKIVKTERKLEETLEFVRQLTGLHYSIVQSYKEIAENAVQNNFDDALDFERNVFSPKWGSKLNKEALDKNIKHVKK